MLPEGNSLTFPVSLAIVGVFEQFLLLEPLGVLSHGEVSLGPMTQLLAGIVPLPITVPWIVVGVYASNNRADNMVL